MNFVCVLARDATQGAWKRGKAFGLDVFATVVAFTRDVLALEGAAYGLHLYVPAVLGKVVSPVDFIGHGYAPAVWGLELIYADGN
jgi:hypothetical protein